MSLMSLMSRWSSSMNLLDLARSALMNGTPQDSTPAAKPQAEPAQSDPDTERRRAKALALLAEHPNWRRVVIAESGNPIVIGVAIRDLGYGELEIPAARYDARTLLELMDQYSGAPSQTLH